MKRLFLCKKNGPPLFKQLQLLTGDLFLIKNSAGHPFELGTEKDSTLRNDWLERLGAKQRVAPRNGICFWV